MAKTALAFSIMPDSPIEKIVEWTKDAEEMGYAAVFMSGGIRPSSTALCQTVLFCKGFIALLSYPLLSCFILYCKVH